MNADRSLAAWTGMQDAQDPMGPYARIYRARVVAQADDADEVDVRPDDALLPDMAKIPLRHGIPGLRVQVALGSYVRVGWDDGRPDKPFAALWNGETHVIKLTLVADQIKLGSRTASEAMIRGTSYRAAEDSLFGQLQAALAAMAAACIAGPLTPLQPGLQTAILALQQFLTGSSAAGGYLSPKVAGE
jgi:hypothetical protein